MHRCVLCRHLFWARVHALETRAEAEFLVPSTQYRTHYPLCRTLGSTFRANLSNHRATRTLLLYLQPGSVDTASRLHLLRELRALLFPNQVLQ